MSETLERQQSALELEATPFTATHSRTPSAASNISVALRRAAVSAEDPAEPASLELVDLSAPF